MSQATRLHDDVLLLQSKIKMPLVQLGVTTTAIRTSRGVVLISPGKNIRDYESTLEDFGRVTDIVAPNLLHHVSIHTARELFPQANLWGVDGLKAKRADVPWDKTLTPSTWSYDDEIQMIPVEGIPSCNEAVFFHRESKTLIATDLFFNITKPKGLGAWIIFHLFGTYKKFAVSSFYMRFVKDEASFKNSIQKIFALDFDKIVVAHGDAVSTGAKAKVEAALRERNLLV